MTDKNLLNLSSRTPAQRVEGSAVVRTGDKQIPPQASPSFGMTCYCFALVRDDIKRKPTIHLSSRTPAQRVEGSAVVRTGDKQIPPQASPSFGMTCYCFALTRDDTCFALVRDDIKCKRTTHPVIPNTRAAGGGICCCDTTGYKQIPPQASPSFGMTRYCFGFVRDDIKRKPTIHRSSRRPAQQAEGSAVVRIPATSRSLLRLRPRSG